MFQAVVSSISIAFCGAYALASLVRRGRPASVYFMSLVLICAAALELFDLFTIVYPDNALYWKRYALVAESLLPAAWLLYSLAHARDVEFKKVPIFQWVLLAAAAVLPAVAFMVPMDLFFYSPDFVDEKVLFLGTPGFYFYIVFLVLVIVALVNLETTFTSSSAASRWKIKFETIGAGLILAAIVFYYSQGLLYRTINMNLLPVRSVALAAAVILVAYSRLARGYGVRIHVSRHMAYKSVVLMVVGLYLLGLGLMGEGLKHFGESFHRSMVIAIAFIVGAALLIFLLSETFKRKIGVLLHKHFYQNKYDYRAQWLRFTDRLSMSKSGEDLLRSILVGYCETFGMGYGVLFFRDEGSGEDEFTVASAYEVVHENMQVPPDDPMVLFMAEKKWVVNMQEDVSDAVSRSAVTRLGGVTFVVPLFTDDSLSGFIVLGRPINPDETYNYEDYDLMKTLARQASSAILNLHLAAQLSVAREMEAIGKVSAFVIHDLKNLVYTVSLILDNAKDYIDNPEFQRDMLESLNNSVARMKGLISRLKNLPEKGELEKKPVDLMKLSGDTAAIISCAALTVSGTEVVADIDSEEIGKVLLNLLTNAVEATEGKGPVSVHVALEDDACIRVTDGGCGMSREFMHGRLFQPFQTTKKKGLGIGLYQCSQIVKAHGGRIDVESEPGKGSVFTVHLPLTKQLGS